MKANQNKKLERLTVGFSLWSTSFSLQIWTHLHLFYVIFPFFSPTLTFFFLNLAISLPQVLHPNLNFAVQQMRYVLISMRAFFFAFDFLLFCNFMFGSSSPLHLQINIQQIILHYSQMDIKTYNKAFNELLIKGLNHSFVKEIDPADQEVAYCNDTDTVQYKSIAKKDLMRVLFTIVDINVIWSFIEGYFRKTYYVGFKIGLVNDGGSKWLEITIDNEGLTNFMKTFKEIEEVGVTSGRKKFDAAFDALGKKLASIKRHFTASSFQMMLQCAQINQNKGNATLGNISFFTKHDKKEKTWIAFEKNQFTVYYGISFDDRFEQQLAKIYFSELLDAKKHVHNTPAVTISESQLPKFLIDSFPNEKSQKYQFSNGIIAFTLYGSLVKNHRTMATYLANFRTYAYYHIQASKCYLHSRVLRRINTFYKDMTNARIQPFSDK